MTWTARRDTGATAHRRSGEPQSGESEERFHVTDHDLVVGASMRVLREKHASVAAFARALSQTLGRSRLSRQAVYNWESGRSRVPAAVWIAAAGMAHMSLDEAFEAGRRRRARFIRAGQRAPTDVSAGERRR